MFGYFSHEIIRKHVIVFGNLFNDITIERKDLDGERVQTLAIPIAYGPKQKFIVRLETDADLDRDDPLTLPRLGFEMSGISYDPSRKLPSHKKISVVYEEDKTRKKIQYMPVPYNIDFILSLMVRNADDGTQILEQILPYFHPKWDTAIRLVPETETVMDVPLILNNVNLQDTYDGDFQQTRRVLIWDLNFTMKTFFYGPVNHSGVITRTNINLYANTAPGTSRTSLITMVPGLTPELKPTTNSAASIHRDLISADDDYGFASDIYVE